MSTTARTTVGRTVATAITLALGAGMSLGALPAHAATTDTTATVGRTATLMGTTHEEWTRPFGYSDFELSGLFQLQPRGGADSIYAYCIEMNIKVDPDTHPTYAASGWNTYQSQEVSTSRWAAHKDQVAWILTHSVPNISGQELVDRVGGISNISEIDLVTATQAAIWHFTSGYQPEYSDALVLAGFNDGTPPRAGFQAKRIYDYLVAGAENASTATAPAPVLEMSAKPGADATTPIPVSIDTTATEVTLTVTDSATLVDAKGAPLADADPSVAGLQVLATTPVFVKPVADATGSAQVTASVTGATAPIGTIWKHDGIQSLISASVSKIDTNATTDISWTHQAPAPTPTETSTPVSPYPTPTDSPSSPATETPTSPATTPAPSDSTTTTPATPTDTPSSPYTEAPTTPAPSESTRTTPATPTDTATTPAPSESTTTAPAAPVVKIGTTATDSADGDKLVAPAGGIVKDAVRYEGLTPGATYVVTGELMDKATGQPTGITSEAKFTADTTGTGIVDVYFTVNQANAGKQLVAFETVSEILGGGSGTKIVGEHKDITDAAQTVTVNHALSVRTSATDQADGDKIIAATGGHVVDAVSYTGLEPGKTYTITGELMDKATGQATGVTGRTTFTATDSDGIATVTFDVPATQAGKTLVVFEKIYAMGADGKPGTTPVGTHEDITDVAQTIVVDKPVTTVPTTPATPIPSTPAPTTPAPSTPAPSTTTPSAPAPSSPAPTTTPSTPAPTTPAPTTVKPGTPVPTTRPIVKPGKPAVRMVTRTFQVDGYRPRTAADARLVAALDNDGLLKYREDRRMWGKNIWQFVTVRVPANATHAQVITAINNATNAAVGDVTTTSKVRTAKPGHRVTIAWEIGKGATPKLAWGKNKNIAQTFFARS